MKMEVLAVQQQYQTYGVLGSNKVRDWTSTLTPPQSLATNLTNNNTTKIQTSPKSQSNNTTTTTTNNLPYLQNNTTNKIKNSISKKSKPSSNIISSSSASNKIRNAATVAAATIQPSYTIAHHHQPQHYNTPQNININNTNNLFYCDDIDAAAVDELSLRLLDELRAAKSRHLTCTEVSLPCDLTPRIAAEIIRVSEKEACGIRGCTIYIEFEDEPNNSRRIAALKLDAETVSTFEVYLTLRQDHRGWTALLPQFMKSLARTITISPEFTITKHKLYSPQQSSYRFGATAVAVPTATAARTSSFT